MSIRFFTSITASDDVAGCRDLEVGWMIHLSTYAQSLTRFLIRKPSIRKVLDWPKLVKGIVMKVLF